MTMYVYRCMYVYIKWKPSSRGNFRESHNKPKDRKTKNLNRNSTANLITQNGIGRPKVNESQATQRYDKLRSLKRGFNQPAEKRESNWLRTQSNKHAPTVKSTATPKQLMRPEKNKNIRKSTWPARVSYKNRLRRSPAKNGTVIPKNKSR